MAPNGASAAVSPPKAEFPDLKFTERPADFTKRAVASFGHVWEIPLPPPYPRLFGLAGAEGLRAFADQSKINRFPVADRNNLTFSWASNGFPGLPPIDGQCFLDRKINFTAFATWDVAERFVQNTDKALIAALQDAGKDGKPFSYWTFSSRFIFAQYSKQFFGLGIEDWQGGKQTDTVITAMEEAFTLFGSKSPDLQLHARAKHILQTLYYRSVLAEIRAKPDKYKDAFLARYMQSELSRKLNDDELIADMVQMLCPGTFALANQGVPLMYRLLQHPDMRAKIAAEVKTLPTPVTIKALLSLKYTEAFVKEALRYYPAVFTLKGATMVDFEVEGKLIPSGTVALGCLWGTLNDPETFPDPDEFVPERHLPPRSEGKEETFNNYEVVFGAGDMDKGHACGGKWIAFAHLVHITARLVQNWSFKMVDPNEKIVWPQFAAKAENGLMIQRA